MSLGASGGFTALEIASGYLLGQDAGADALPDRDRAASARRQLEAVVARALSRPPCLVAFSGGRDSSAVLALAAAVARREGLAPPIPISYRFSGAAETEESEWQELVVRHLGLADRQTLELEDELDALGPIARRTLERHGLYWPANAHFVEPALAAAGGGSLLTGAGGDQLLDPGRHARAAALLARKRRPALRDAPRFGLAVAPLRVRAAVRLRRDPPRVLCPWLRPGALAALEGALARDDAAEPIRRRAWAAWVWRARATQAGLRIMSSLAADAGAALEHPFLDPAFVAAYAEESRREPPPTRTAALRALVGDLLPAAVCDRETKAVFGSTFWHRHATAYAATLTAEDVDSELVDGRRALELWRAAPGSDVPVFRSLTLLQSLWLAGRGASGGRVEQPGGGGGGLAPVTRATEPDTRQARELEER